ncbi:MAG: insulinase family protein [Clostridia bacterium]|nr:insulinase family protein [Clostridia bacterium]
MVQNKTYENGLRLLHTQLPNVKSFTLMVYTMVGSREEEKEQEGLAHLLEHMFFKSTKNRNTMQVIDELEELGSHNASTSKEATRFYISSLNTNAERCFDIISDCYCNPLFKEEDLVTEKETVCSEIDYYADKHEETSYSNCFKLLFKNNPKLAHDIIGSKSTVRNATSDVLHAFHDKYYTTGRTIIATAGDIPFEKIDELVVKYFLNNIKTCEPAVCYDDTKINADVEVNEYIFESRDTDQFYFFAGMQCENEDNQTNLTLSLLNRIMGGSLSSRLSKSLREQHGLVYGVCTGGFNFRDIKLKYLDFMCGKENAQKALELVKEVFEDMQKGNITQKELDLVKNSRKTELALADERTTSLVYNMINEYLYKNRNYDINTTFEEIDAITLEDVNKIAKDYFANKKYSIGIVSKEDDINPLKIFE